LITKWSIPRVLSAQNRLVLPRVLLPSAPEVGITLGETSANHKHWGSDLLDCSSADNAGALRAPRWLHPYSC
jgi:hypothetical protein